MTDVNVTVRPTVVTVSTNPAVGPVSSVFGRVGAVTAATSDYDASQVDNDSSVSGATVADALNALSSSSSIIGVGVGEVGVVNAGAGTLVKYDTITEAIAAATPGSEEVVVGPGTWVETLTIPASLAVRGTQQGAVTIVAASAAPAITLSNGSAISHLRVVAGQAGQPGVTFGGASGQAATVQDCAFVGAGGESGISSTGAGVLTVNRVVYLTGTATYFVHADGGALSAVSVLVASGTLTAPLACTGGGTLNADGLAYDGTPASTTITHGLLVDGAGSETVVTTPTFIGSTNGVRIEADGVSVTLTYARVEVTGDAVSVASGLTGAGTTLRNLYPLVDTPGTDATSEWLSGASLFVIAANDVGLDRQLRMVGMELNVGSTEHPAETNLGEGDSYTRGMLVYTRTAGGVFADVTSDMVDSGTTTALPGTATDNAFYFGSAAYDIDGNPHRFHGIKADVATAAALGAGELIAELWTGAAWEEVQTMSVRDAAPIPYGSALLERAQNEQVYFNYASVEDSWAVSDPVGYGESLHWLRIRVSSTITTAPALRTVKLHANRMNAAEDGFVQLFGRARYAQNLTYDLGLLEAGGASPGNADIYLSDNLDVGRVENSFVSSATDRIAAVFALPANIDTSSGLKLRLYYMGTSATAGDVVGVVRWAVSEEGQGVYTSSGSAPTTAPGEQSQALLVSIGAGENNTIKTLTTTLDISDVVTVDPSGAPTLLWVSVERTGGDAADTYPGNVNLIQLTPSYRAWALGAYSF